MRSSLFSSLNFGRPSLRESVSNRPERKDAAGSEYQPALALSHSQQPDGYDSLESAHTFSWSSARKFFTSAFGGKLARKRVQGVFPPAPPLRLEDLPRPSSGLATPAPQVDVRINTTTLSDLLTGEVFGLTSRESLLGLVRKTSTTETVVNDRPLGNSGRRLSLSMPRDGSFSSMVTTVFPPFEEPMEGDQTGTVEADDEGAPSLSQPQFRAGSEGKIAIEDDYFSSGLSKPRMMRIAEKMGWTTSTEDSQALDDLLNSDSNADLEYKGVPSKHGRESPHLSQNYYHFDSLESTYMCPKSPSFTIESLSGSLHGYDLPYQNSLCRSQISTPKEFMDCYCSQHIPNGRGSRSQANTCSEASSRVRSCIIFDSPDGYGTSGYSREGCGTYTFEDPRGRSRARRIFRSAGSRNLRRTMDTVAKTSYGEKWDGEASEFSDAESSSVPGLSSRSGSQVSTPGRKEGPAYATLPRRRGSQVPPVSSGVKLGSINRLRRYTSGFVRPLSRPDLFSLKRSPLVSAKIVLKDGQE